MRYSGESEVSVIPWHHILISRWNEMYDHLLSVIEYAVDYIYFTWPVIV